ncbi:unnamed protein product, partial [Oppiella nova]
KLNKGFPGVQVDNIWSLTVKNLVVPPTVFVGQSVKLSCNYELNGDRLSTIKWLKDDKEFYRYGPKGLIAHYTMPGIDIDLARSSDSSVFLKHVNIHSDGSYRWVRVPPESGPSITSSRLEYRVGDIVSLKCVSSKSKPSATLMWHINEQRRDSEYDIVNTTQSYGEGLESSGLTLKFVAQYKHYRDGRLGFKCTAITPTIYITSDAVFTDTDQPPPTINP